MEQISAIMETGAIIGRPVARMDAHSTGRFCPRSCGSRRRMVRARLWRNATMVRDTTMGCYWGECTRHRAVNHGDPRHRSVRGQGYGNRDVVAGREDGVAYSSVLGNWK